MPNAYQASCIAPSPVKNRHEINSEPYFNLHSKSTNMDNIFSSLNDKQAEAVRATEGRVRIVAGAGSGKTRVLAHRYAYLVNEMGIDPANILCMTFTNKAAREMKTRIANMVHAAHVNDLVCTIHGFCVKVLRREIHRIGYPKNFNIIDEEDVKSLAKQVMEEVGLDRTAATVRQFIKGVQKYKYDSFYKAPMSYIESIILNKKPPEEELNDAERFVLLQLKAFSLDFNDIILFALHILNNHADAREYWQKQLNYIMVDEVQDCSTTDWEIINLISQEYQNLFIVGDPDQAIYEWRGAKPKSFIEFPAETDIILNENYRSTPDILNVANSVIAHNQDRIPKDLFTQKPKDRIAVHHHAKSEKDESDWIAKQIATLTQKGCKNSDIAILFRAAFQSREIEQALLRKHIKYVVWGGIRFFERKEIKDALAYLRLVAYQDDLSFVRVINTPSRKFGKAKLARLQTLAKQEGTSLYATLKKHLRDKEFDKEAFAKFIELIEDCIKAKDNTKTSDMLEYLLQESGLKDLLREDEDEDRLENIQELASSILHYEKVNINEEISLDTYLQDIALYTNADYKDDGDTVKLMTIHQSKGLEFPIVFICGVTEGIFPNHRSIRERKKPALEEERRLMYVAITRAEKAVFLTESEGFDYTHKTSRCPSRFLMEIDRDIIKVDGDIPPEIWQGTFNLVRKLDAEIYMDGSMEEDEEEEDALKPGDKVTHKVLGEGTILDYDEERDSFKIDFNGSIRFIRASFLTK